MIKAATQGGFCRFWQALQQLYNTWVSATKKGRAQRHGPMPRTTNEDLATSGSIRPKAAMVSADAVAVCLRDDAA